MRPAVRIPSPPAMSQCEPPVHFMIAGILNPGALFDPIIPLPRRFLCRQRKDAGHGGIRSHRASLRVGRLSVDDFELNSAMGPRSDSTKDDAERLSGMALLADHATYVFLCHSQLKD